MNCDMPEVSVVLPTYNGEKYLRESIDSIRRQSLKNWELIVVNDCSNDSTQNIINEYVELDDRIICVKNEHNLKLPGSLNKGFEIARGRYYTWTSDDNIYEATALEEMVAFLKENRETPMVAANMLIINNEGTVVGEKHCKSNQYMAYGNSVGACFLYRSEVAATVGKYNEALFLVEDYEFWMRVLFECGEIGVIKKNLYRYREHEFSLSSQRKKDVKRNLNILRKSHLESLLGLASMNEDLMVKLYCEMNAEEQLSGEEIEQFRNNSRFLNNCVKLDMNKPIVVYGAGKYGQASLKLLKHITFFVDQNPRLTGKKIAGIEVLSPDELSGMKEKYQIVVAIHYLNLYSALRYLVDNGIHSYSLIQDFLCESNNRRVFLNELDKISIYKS